MTFRSESSDSLKNNSQWNLGPLWIDPDLRFSLEYDSSIYGTYGGLPPVADTIGTVAVPVDFHPGLAGPVHPQLSRISPSIIYFFEHSDESSFNNSYSLAARLLLFRRLVLIGIPRI